MALAITLLAAPGSSSGGVPIGCGATITADTTLTADLLDCPNNGIVIGADGITLDLDGHTIDGDGALVDPCPEGEGCDVGIDNNGHDGVTVKDGRVRQFALGVGIFQTDGNRILRIRAARNTFPGIVFGASTDGLMRGNVARANGLDTDEAGAVVFALRRSLVAGNELVANGDVGLIASETKRTRIARNRIADNFEAGLLLDAAVRDAVFGNHVVRNGDGIILSGDRNDVRQNHVRDSLGCGRRCGGFGISFEDGDHNVIARNGINTAKRAGIRVGFVSVEGNSLRRNRVRDAAEDGISIATEATHTVLNGNHARGAGDDGIDVQNRHTSLRGNGASHNGDLGIEAVRGVHDRGLNRAHGNGDPRQCTHVDCI